MSLHEFLSSTSGGPALLAQHGVSVTYTPDGESAKVITAAPHTQGVEDIDDGPMRARGRDCVITVLKAAVPTPMVNRDRVSVPAKWFDETVTSGTALATVVEIVAGQTPSGCWRLRLNRQGSP